MNLFIQHLINSIIQIVLFSLLPIIWWFVTARKNAGFFKWIGLKGIGAGDDGQGTEGRTSSIRQTLIWMAGIIAAFIVLSIYMLTSVKGVETATSDFAGLGAAAIPAILVYAVLHTALSEEILFRGFLLKRISGKFGFTAGNIIQSVIFGLLHGFMFFFATGPVKAVIIVLFTGAIGWFMGFVNEKKAGGSILPSWCIHAAANFFSGICSAFLLF